MHTTAAVFDSSRALTVAFIHGSEDCMFCGLITWEIQARNMFANLNKIETGGKRNKQFAFEKLTYNTIMMQIVQYYQLFVICK